jgi:hypothetical protein
MYPGKSGATRKRGRLWRWALALIVLYFLPVGYQVLAYYTDPGRDAAWWSRRGDSSEQAPDPAMTDDAIIQVYAARAVRWRGALGVHTWIATKGSDEDFYRRLEVMGYALRWSNQSVQVRRGDPDRYWFGNRPVLLRELRGGSDVDRLIERMHRAAREYPHNHRYKVWPGPNSNTFIAHLARQIPELALELPPTAIGKDYLPEGGIFQTPPSGSGLQVSLAGLLGVMVAPEEGVELNILGLTAGVDFSPPAIKLPGIGRIGYEDFERKSMP